MAGEEQNTQQPTGGKGTGFHTEKQKISKGELPKQEGAIAILVHEKVKTVDEVGPYVASEKRKRGCPSSGLSEQDRGKMQNEDFQRCRKKKKDRSLRLQNIEKQQNDFFEKFKISSVEHLEAEFKRFQQKQKTLEALCEKLGVTEEGLEAEFRRLQQTEIKYNALCDKFGVAQVGLEVPIGDFIELNDLTSFLTEDFIELNDLTSFLTEDFIELNDLTSFHTEDFIEMDDLTDFNMEMFGSLLDGQSPALGREEAILNESPHQDKFASFFDGQASALGRGEVTMNEPPVQYELQREDYMPSSSKHYSLNKLENEIIKQSKDHSN